jgi:hypothetical protein
MAKDATFSIAIFLLNACYVLFTCLVDPRGVNRAWMLNQTCISVPVLQLLRFMLRSYRLRRFNLTIGS